MVETYWISVSCPNLTFGIQQVTKTTQTYAASCMISYQCNGSALPCTSVGTKFIKRRNVSYGPEICPVEPG